MSDVTKNSMLTASLLVTGAMPAGPVSLSSWRLVADVMGAQVASLGMRALATALQPWVPLRTPREPRHLQSSHQRKRQLPRSDCHRRGNPHRCARVIPSVLHRILDEAVSLPDPGESPLNRPLIIR